LNLFVSISQTGVSREGTEERIQVLPRNDENLTGDRLLSRETKSGAGAPALASFPTRVNGFPRIVIIPVRSLIKTSFLIQKSEIRISKLEQT
jgi:hypothetical protein